MFKFSVKVGGRGRVCVYKLGCIRGVSLLMPSTVCFLSKYSFVCNTRDESLTDNETIEIILCLSAFRL